MKTFTLNKVKYKNIMSVGGQPIEIQLDKAQKTLITGKNGGGKSTMLEAITFALFGKPFRDVKKGQLVNSTNKKDLLVELWMEYDGKAYYVKRGQKPNVFEVHVEGVQLDESASVKDFQEHFESLIGMSYSSFKQVVVLGTAGYTPFMGLSTPARRKLVEDLLEVSVLAEMDKLNKSTIRELNQQLQVTDLSAQHTQTEIKTHEDYAERQRKLSGDNLARLETMYNELVTEAKGHKSSIESLTDEMSAIVLGDDPTDDMNSIKQKIGASNQQINQFKSVVELYAKGGSCPTCMQQLHSSSDLIDQVKSNIQECEHTSKELGARYALLGDSLSEYQAVQSSIRRIKGEIQNHRALAMAAVEKAKKVQAAITQAKQETVDNSDKVSSLQKELDKIIATKSNIVIEKYRRGIITEMLKDTGIKGAIIKKYIPMFNKQINKYLKSLEADYVFTLNEEFSETIKSRGREDFSYASFSEGEKARIDISLLFTWRDIAEKVSGIKINCLFLDEVFDGSFDDVAVKNVGVILNNMKDTNIFVISHKDHDPQNYGQHLQMKKVGRFTVMEAS